MNMIKLNMIMIICRDHATWSMKWSYDIPAMIIFWSSRLFIIIDDMIIWNDHMNISITGQIYMGPIARMRRLKREKYVFKCEKYDSFRIIAWNKFFFGSPTVARLIWLDKDIKFTKLSFSNIESKEKKSEKLRETLFNFRETLFNQMNFFVIFSSHNNSSCYF